jgi:hypothetical protein
MKRLSDFLDKAINRTGASRTIKAAVVVEQAGHLLSQIMPQLRPGDYKVLSLRNGTLTIAATSPSLAQEIRLRREPLLEVLNDTFPKTEIKRLRFVPMPFDAEGSF